MKLIECYIAGFGALQDRSYRFDEGLSVFCQHNGAGKSTLAAFLKAMLYGMPSYKANSKGFEDRRHYFPFGGGAYGGSLTLSFQGETYCITRRFDAKSEVKDAMTVTCQGAPTDALGKIPGRTIFQVDSDSFERTAFFTADPGELGATTGIAGRLQSFLDNTSGGDYATAFAKLDDAARSLHASRGMSGKIPQQQLLVRRLEQELLDRNQLSDALEASYAARDTLAGQIEAEERALEENQAALLQRERWQRYQALRSEADAKEEKARLLRRQCGETLPTDPQRRELEDCCGIIAQRRSALRFAGLPEEKSRRLAALQEKYPQGVPSQQALDQAQELQQALDCPPPAPEKPGNLGLILAIAGAVLALGGGAGLLFSLVLGAIALALGLGLALCGYLLRRKEKAAYRAALDAQEAAANDTQARLAAILSPYGLARFDSQLRSDGFYLESLSREQTQAEESRLRLQKELDAALSRADAIFTGCGLRLGADEAEDIRRLCANLDALQPMEAEASRAEQAAGDYQRKYALQGAMPQLTADPAQLSRSLAAKRPQLANLQRQIMDTEYRLEDLADCHIRLEEAREQEQALQRQHKLLCAARDCLASAEQALKARHIDPVRSRFDFYADALEDALGAKVALDKDFGLYLQEKGAQYPDRHLSAGQRAVVALCLRLALLDNLYPGDKGPIILDDPFVFLDGEHLEKAKALVRQLSEHWQILYFTCHESRTI
ncbi:MAG: AAA family ATPase [Oscillospiraceae bacterium]|nr:AAA family ATPase [Oscillospiraceae bacterium]